MGFLRGKRSGHANPSARIFFATDIHGSERCFRKWLNAGRVYEADCLILGGDISGKSLVPLVKTGDDTWEGEISGRRVSATGEEELAALRRMVADRGSYTRLSSVEERERLFNDAEAFERAFQEEIAARVREWVALADERLEGSGVAAYMMLGNDDVDELSEIIRGSETVSFAEDGVCELPGGHEMVAVGFATPTPWNTPRECSEEALAELIEAQTSRLERPATAVLNFHCPPRDSNLDQAPQLDENLRPIVTPGGNAVMSVGAGAVRQAVATVGAALGLHGHVHESPAGQMIGSTLCVNPGSEYGEGVLRGAIIDLAADGEIKRWQITQG